jgi:hypothetical protein
VDYMLDIADYYVEGGSFQILQVYLNLKIFCIIKIVVIIKCLRISI